MDMAEFRKTVKKKRTSIPPQIFENWRKPTNESKIEKFVGSVLPSLNHILNSHASIVEKEFNQGNQKTAFENRSIKQGIGIFAPIKRQSSGKLDETNSDDNSDDYDDYDDNISSSSKSAFPKIIGLTPSIMRLFSDYKGLQYSTGQSGTDSDIVSPNPITETTSSVYTPTNHRSQSHSSMVLDDDHYGPHIDDEDLSSDTTGYGSDAAISMNSHNVDPSTGSSIENSLNAKPDVKHEDDLFDKAINTEDFSNITFQNPAAKTLVQVPNDNPSKSPETQIVVKLVLDHDDSLEEMSLSQVKIRSIETSESARPPTRFDGQKAHTVAWSFFLRYLRARIRGGSVAAAFDFLATEYNFLNQMQFIDINEELSASLDAIIMNPPKKMAVPQMRVALSQAIALYIQYHQKSLHAVMDIGSSGNGEQQAMANLESLEKSLDSKQNTITLGTDVGIYARKLVDLKPDRLGPFAYAFAVREWKTALQWVYPQVMKKYESDIVQDVEGKKLTIPENTSGVQSISSNTEEGINEKITHSKEMSVRELIKYIEQNYSKDQSSTNPDSKPENPVVPETEKNQSGFLKSSFLANVEVRPFNGVEGKVDDYIVECIQVSEDRPKTQFKTKQNSHSVAWTLSRHALLGFKGRRAGLLIQYLIQGFIRVQNEIELIEKSIIKSPEGRIEKFAIPYETAENTEYKKALRKDICTAANEGTNILKKIATSTSYSNDLGTAATLYMKCSQAVDTASFPPLKGHSVGHNEGEAMEVLRSNEESLRLTGSKIVESKDKIIKNAINLFDLDIVHFHYKEFQDIAYKDFLRKLTLAFPFLMSVLGDEINNTITAKLNDRRSNATIIPLYNPEDRNRETVGRNRESRGKDSVMQDAITSLSNKHSRSSNANFHR